MDRPPAPSSPLAAATTLDRLDHVAIPVRSIDEAVAWYTSRFACRIAYQDPTWALLEFANARLAFVAPDQHPPHVGISRLDAARFGTLKEHRDGTRSTYVRDPSGNAVEVLDAGSL